MSTALVPRTTRLDLGIVARNVNVYLVGDRAWLSREPAEKFAAHSDHLEVRTVSCSPDW